jgi:hypothetical protein
MKIDRAECRFKVLDDETGPRAITIEPRAGGWVIWLNLKAQTTQKEADELQKRMAKNVSNVTAEPNEAFRFLESPGHRNEAVIQTSAATPRSDGQQTPIYGRHNKPALGPMGDSLDKCGRRGLSPREQSWRHRRRKAGRGKSGVPPHCLPRFSPRAMGGGKSRIGVSLGSGH